MTLRKRRGLKLGFLLFLVPAMLQAQVFDPPSGTDVARTPDEQRIYLLLREEALLVRIRAAVKDGQGEILWQSTAREVTVFGKKVHIRINAQNVTVEAEFTPYMSSRGEEQTMLLAQGQTWVRSGSDVKYQSAMRSMPISLGEPVYFYPLGINMEERPSSGPVLEVEVIVVSLADALGGESQSSPGQER